MQQKDQTLSEYYVSIGGIILRISSELPLQISEGIKRFSTNSEYANINIDVKVMIETCEVPENICGDDLLMNYYKKDNFQYAITKPGILGPLSVAEYTEDFSQITLWINEKEHPETVRSVDKVLQLLPIRQMFAHYGAFVLHSSQIKIGDKGILFTAPSQTGKSTQAKLWEKYEGAKIVCNDRTLLKKEKNGFRSYGFPIDGSAPVYSNKCLDIGAIIILRQGKENRIIRAMLGEGLKYLMEQTVLDIWCAEEIIAIREMWIEILGKYPVYIMECTPDREAVICLRRRLEEEGVI